jgi:myo-inositol 2-dehydrogenase / D-chiro-inositol 1-dehydrogenase
MSDRRARLVVAGLGRIGRLHASNLAGRVPSASLVGVVDAVEPLARSIGELHGVPWSTSLDGALRDRRVDGVVIAAPTRLHCEIVELAAGAGKHVFCEKPLGFGVEAARQAVDGARAAGVHVQVGFQRRFDRDWVTLKEALEGGELGRLLLLRSSHRDARPSAAALGDLFVDVAVHDLDAARWLGGEVTEVFALPRRGAGEPPAAGAAIALRFETRALGLMDVSRDARYGFECSAEVVGAKATARTGYLQRRGDVELLRDRSASRRLPADHAERHAAAYVGELEHFGELVMGRRAPRSTGDDAVAALELAQLAARSAELGVPLTADALAGAEGFR